MERHLKLTIAGHGSIGHYIEDLFEPLHSINIYDPPLGFNEADTLVDTDFVLICAPTPSNEDGSCNTTIVEQIVDLANPRKAIVCTSTVAIGTTDKLINRTGKSIVFAPEYAGETSEHPLRNPVNRDFLIFGGYGSPVDEASSLFENAYCEAGAKVNVLKTKPIQAEITKYMENSFLATKVAFVNEFYDLCTLVGADFDEVRDLWLQDSRVGESHTVVTEERGFGGKCLPKDTNAVAATGRRLGQPLEIMEAVINANKSHKSRGGRYS